MLAKIVILVLLFFILLSLGWGFFYLARDKSNSKRTLRALMIRIGITVILAILILVGIFTGFIVPHPIG